MKDHHYPLRHQAYAVLQRVGMKQRVAKNLLKAHVEITPGLIDAIADIIFDGQRLLKLLKGTTDETETALGQDPSSTGSRRDGGSNVHALGLLRGCPRTACLLGGDGGQGTAPGSAVGPDDPAHTQLDDTAVQ